MRLIDKDRLISILNAKADMALGEPKKYFANVAQMVELLPDVDAVEVVRCRDCKHWKTYGNFMNRRTDGTCLCLCKYHYCSYAERA